MLFSALRRAHLDISSGLGPRAPGTARINWGKFSGGSPLEPGGAVMAGAVALQGEARDRLAQPGAKMDPGGLKAAPSTCREMVEKRQPERQGASAGPNESGSNGT